MGRMACTEPQCLYNGAPYPSPPLVPWSRKSTAIPLLPLWAVWPVQSLSVCTTVHLTTHPLLVPWSRKSRAIPLLPLWAVWPVQSLSACTTVHLTTHPLLVPWSRKSRATPLLPLWAVRPVQSLSACTTVHFIFFYYYQTGIICVRNVAQGKS